MKKQFCIGNITKVRWHYVNHKYGYMAWGHMRESFDKNSYISKQHPHLETAVITEMDTTMNPDKSYAYVCIDNNKLLIRNLFDSKHEKEFSQKNTFFEDELFYDLFLDDTQNLLDEYLKLGNQSRQDNYLLYYCVEYEPNHNLDLDLLLYCGELERTKSELEDKLRLIDIQNDLKINKKNKSFFSYFW